jgi:hypothetical protein
MNFHEHEKTGKPARSFQSAAVEEMGIKEGDDWWNKECRKTGMARFGSKSNARKMASAMIAKIPLPLASHIARCYYPLHESDSNKTRAEIWPVDSDTRSGAEKCPSGG